MAGNASIGTAWFTVKPEMKGVQAEIQKALNAGFKGVADDIAKKAGIGAAVGGAILDGIKAVASKAAAAVGEIMRNGMETMDSVIRSQNALEQMGYDSGAVAINFSNSERTQIKPLRELATFLMDS